MAMYNNYQLDKESAYRSSGSPQAPRPVPNPAQYGAGSSITRPPAAATTQSSSPAWTATLPPAQQAPAGSPLPATPYKGSIIAPQSVVGLSPEERQRIYNQARGNFLGGMNASGQGLIGQMGGRGLVAGESGIADSALGQMWQGGLQKYGDVIGGIATQEAKDRFGQGLALDQFNSQQNQWSQEFGAQREDAASQDLLNWLSMMQGSQAAQYAPYWDAISQGANT